LAFQLAEIKALCEVLFEVWIHSLVRIRRVPVSKQDVGPTEYLTGSKATTNATTGAVVTPYEVTFQGFSPELAAVLTGLEHSKVAFMVKMLDVERGQTEAPIMEMPLPVQEIPGVAPVPNRPQSGEDLMRRRYGRTPGGSAAGGRSQEYLRRYGQAPGAPGVRPAPGASYVPAGSGRRGPETVLEEQQLKVTLTVEAVRLPVSTQ
jgi:hypothetical protein